jgi:large subunit ribosomal protein L29
MKFEELKGLSPEELTKKQKELQRDLFQAKMKNSLGQLASPIQIRALRRNIAQLLTAQSQKQG